MPSWTEFLDLARAPDSIPDGAGRHGDSRWAGASWDEALELAAAGWTRALPEVDVGIAALRERSGDGLRSTTLLPCWDVTGGEVDVGAYLSGVPECMVDAVPSWTSARGRVVTFLVPASCSHTVAHRTIRNRGIALAALCTAIIEAGHSVEIWSGFSARVGRERFSAVAKVIPAGEPLDVGRLLFAMAHPAMLRRLWFGVWDSSARRSAALLKRSRYGIPHPSRAEDLAEDIADPYVFPNLDRHDTRWATLDSARTWCEDLFRGLGLLN
ncbi:DUF7192 family protein [Amycolatopsis sp. CA-230715]|uniref:DUF7192 family protein n=1 Tax=Amycolatopsis sp. CA-230715 TaxID=2745196 RepID=UPI001C0275AB|nr:hypothetical protein [Amycolatopsis sp. CA-230715]